MNQTKNFYEVQRGKADRLAYDLGARYYYDSFMREQFYGEARYNLSFRYYLESRQVDSESNLRELGHFSNMMQVFTKIDRPHAVVFVNTPHSMGYNTDLKELTVLR